MTLSLALVMAPRPRASLFPLAETSHVRSTEMTVIHVLRRRDPGRPRRSRRLGRRGPIALLAQQMRT